MSIPGTPPPAGFDPLPQPVAIAHDWLLGMRGGEWVLDALLKLLPGAEIHTLFYRPQALASSLQRCPVIPSGLNRLPGVGRYYRWLLPLLPGAVGRMRVRPEARLLLKTSHCVAHGAGVGLGRGVPQVHYYFSPMRYLYDQADAYAAGVGDAAAGRAGLRALGVIGERLKKWDVAAAQRADHVWAISQFVAERVERVYGRKAEVIYPPVRTEVFTPGPGGQGRGGERVDEDLIVSALVPYKRVDLAIAAANRLGRPLRVVGAGPLRHELEKMAGAKIIFEGRASEARLIELYRTRRMLIFPGIEDFGIVPLEAMACGLPVLAQRGGGLLETHVAGVTGEFYDGDARAAGLDNLCAAWHEFAPERYDSNALRSHALKFSEGQFISAMHGRLEPLLRANVGTV